MVLFAAGCGTVPVEEGEVEQATTCGVQLAVYPVRAKHNNGYDSTAGNASLWSCDDAHSNSDYNSQHLGNDIWAAEGAPVAATVAGTLTLTGFSSYSGNKVTIKDKCGWYHFYCHLKTIAPGMKDGVVVKAGDIIGSVGKTGTASNGVVHLHYSIYPDGNYDKGINPWPYLHAVEKAVCGPVNQPPTGKLAPPTCAAQGLTGTASDPNATSTALRVVLWFDGTAATNTFLDLKTAAGKFAGTLPDALRDGKEHSVLAYTYDTTDTAYKSPIQLSGSPGKITCAPPVQPADMGAADDLADGEPGSGEDAGGDPDPDLSPDPNPGAGPGGSCTMAPRGPIAGSGVLLLACGLLLLALRRRGQV
jgi:hypothetical protein